MIDLAARVTPPRLLPPAWQARGATVSVDELLSQDEAVRSLKANAEGKRAEANAASSKLSAKLPATAKTSVPPKQPPKPSATKLVNLINNVLMPKQPQCNIGRTAEYLLARSTGRCG